MREKADLQEEIDKLADYIFNEVPGEPSLSEGAVDTIIRLPREAVAEIARREAAFHAGGL
ncbi:hypothetical protein MYX84_16465 [Acidobacteria bacterium AH-259-O06]|nr:hypothetical protein [Acidobacteria bacterium AH-259-O06]